LAAPPTYRAVDGAATASVFTWSDTNGDGIHDPQEQPLPWVTTRVAYPDFLTGSYAWGHAWLFKPGCATACWQGEAVSVKTPPGYAPTTPLQVSLAGDDRDYYFGFHLKNEDALVSFPREPSCYLAFAHRGARLADFHNSQDRH